MAMSECSLWQLATEGDVEGVRLRIQGFPEEFNKKRGPQFTTPLMQACSNNHSEVVKLLLEAEDVDIAVRDKGDATCVHWAAGHSPLCLALIMSHADQADVETEFYRPDLPGNTPLHWAGMFGQYSSCEILLAAGVVAPLRIQNHDGKTPAKLAYNPETGRRNAGELLRKAHERIIADRPTNLYIDLQTACEWGLLSVAQRLIDKGAMANHDEEVLQACIGKNNRFTTVETRNALIELLNDHVSDSVTLFSVGHQTSVVRIRSSSFWEMARSGHVAEVNEYLKSNKDEIDKKGGEMFTTGLMEAASGNHHDVFNILLEHGASVHIRDKEDASCLHYAAGASSSACLSSLLAKNLEFVKEEIGRKDGSGNTPLHWAARKGRLPCCELLLTAEGHKTLFIENYDGKCPDKLAEESDNSNTATKAYLNKAKVDEIRKSQEGLYSDDDWDSVYNPDSDDADPDSDYADDYDDSYSYFM